MRADPGEVRRMAAKARVRSQPRERLARALVKLAGGQGEVVRHAESPWTSVTFSGSRHRVELVFAGLEAMAAGEHFIEALAEHEFAIPGQLVADAAVVSTVQETLPEPRLTVEAELLLLEDS